MDLKSAYKQWAIAPVDVPKAILILKDPSNDAVMGFECLTLPFGSVASVTCFNRIARLYQRILHEVCVVAANYFDDYPIVELSPLATNCESTLKAVSKLLGFSVAFDKDLPFAQKTDILGVTVNLTDADRRHVYVCNKQSRMDDMSAALEKVLAEGRVQPASLPSMFGRLQFCEAQLLGRQGRLAMADLRSLERLRDNDVKLTDDQKLAFASLLDRTKHGKPSLLDHHPQCWFLQMELVNHMATLFLDQWVA